jgi:hypothetical protein
MRASFSVAFYQALKFTNMSSQAATACLFGASRWTVFRRAAACQPQKAAHLSFSTMTKEKALFVKDDE